jgi:hypothetical protein
MSEAIWWTITDDSRLNWKWSQYHSTHISKQTKKKCMKNLNSIQQYVCKLFHFICSSQNIQYYFHGTKMPETLHNHFQHYRLNIYTIPLLPTKFFTTELWILLDKTAAITASFQCHHAIHNKMYCFQISYYIKSRTAVHLGVMFRTPICASRMCFCRN